MSPSELLCLCHLRLLRLTCVWNSCKPCANQFQPRMYHPLSLHLQNIDSTAVFKPYNLQTPIIHPHITLAGTSPQATFPTETHNLGTTSLRFPNNFCFFNVICGRSRWSLFLVPAIPIKGILAPAPSARMDMMSM